MENKTLKPSIYVVLIVILVILLIMAVGDLGPFAGGTTARMPADGIDSNLIVFWGGGGSLETKALEDGLDKFTPGGKEGGKITSIVFHRADGKIFVADLKGKEIKPCAAVVDGRIIGVEFENGKVVQTENPKCKRILSPKRITGLSKSVTIRAIGSGECDIDCYGGYLMERCP